MGYSDKNGTIELEDGRPGLVKWNLSKFILDNKIVVEENVLGDEPCAWWNCHPS